MNEDMQQRRNSLTGSFCSMFTWCFQAEREMEAESQFLPNASTPPKNKMMVQQLMIGIRGPGYTILSRTHVPPTWIDDEEAKSCPTCSITFDLFNRKHHCRACGLIFCHKCTDHFDCVYKYNFHEPVRVCDTCHIQAKVENLFYEKHLPLLEQGEYFTKHGMFLKRIVELKLIPSRNLFQYSDIDLETRQFTGEIKAIPFDSIKEIKEASTDKENWNHSIILCTDDQQEHRFDAMTLHRKKKWFEAIKNALEVRNGWLFIEKEKKQKQLEEENEEAKKITQMIQQLENQKVLFQEEKLRKRKEKRDELRAKYQLAPLQSNNKHNHHTTAPSAS